MQRIVIAIWKIGATTYDEDVEHKHNIFSNENIFKKGKIKTIYFYDAIKEQWR